MGRWIAVGLGLAAALAAHVAHAEPLPQAVADILDAAADDPETLAAVVKAARKANPGAAADIDAHVAALRVRADARKAEQAATKGFFGGWTGKVEFGGSISTGNTDERGGVVSLALDKQTPRWGHDFNLSVDSKQEEDKTTKDRYFGAYSLQRKLTPRVYAVGVLWGERDRFAGYNFRFSESLGLGYRLVETPTLKLRAEVGPALRQSEYLTTGYETTVAGRLAGYLSWRILPRLEFSQSLVTYLEEKNSTVLASTALTTVLQRRISLRASYEVRHEEDPPNDRKNTDSTTRATLVFSF